MEAHDSTRASFGLRAQAIALATRVDPGLANRSFTEGYLAQPLVMAHGSALAGTSRAYSRSTSKGSRSTEDS
jgi:hypothetical protein